MKLEFSRKILEKYSHVKFHENLSSGSRVVPCGWLDGRTDMTKLTVASHNFVNGPKNHTLLIFLLFGTIIFVEHK